MSILQNCVRRADARAGRLLVLAGALVVFRKGARRGNWLIYNEPTRCNPLPRLCLRLQPHAEGYVLDAWTWISRGDDCSGWVLAASWSNAGQIRIARLQRGRWEEELFALFEASHATLH